MRPVVISNGFRAVVNNAMGAGGGGEITMGAGVGYTRGKSQFSPRFIGKNSYC